LRRGSSFRLGEQARFADTSFAGNQNNASLPAPRLVNSRAQSGEMIRAPNANRTEHRSVKRHLHDGITFLFLCACAAAKSFRFFDEASLIWWSDPDHALLVPAGSRRIAAISSRTPKRSG
jgi:hypothetical protein